LSIGLTILCIAVAAIYVFFWPRPGHDRPRPRPLIVHLVLRWLHSVVWLLFALAGLSWTVEARTLAGYLSVVALFLYLVFVTTLVLDRRAGRRIRL
jgi:hypothetical protein